MQKLVIVTIALTLGVSIAGCGGGSSTGAPSDHSTAGVIAMHAEIESLARAGRFNGICADYLAPALQARLGANCSGLVQEEMAKNGLHPSITNVVVNGNEATYTVVGGKGETDKALYVGGHWRASE